MNTITPRLGVLGGMGPEATALFYRRVIARTVASCDREHIETLIFSDISIPDRSASIAGGREDELRAHLIRDARLLEHCGCTAIAIPCNASHRYADDIAAALTTCRVIHMIREAAARLAESGFGRAGILAADGTISTGLYQTACRAVGVEAVVPDEDTQRVVMRIIYDQIKAGGRGDPGDFAIVDAHLRGLGCDCGLLACTELSVYRHNHPVSGFYVDAMEILAERAVETCGKKLAPQ